MISDVEHLFICWLTICMSFLRNVCSSPLPIFKLGYLGGFLVTEFLMYFVLVPYILTPYQICGLQIFLSYLRLPFHFIDCFLRCTEAFSLI